MRYQITDSKTGKTLGTARDLIVANALFDAIRKQYSDTHTQLDDTELSVVLRLSHILEG